MKFDIPPGKLNKVVKKAFRQPLSVDDRGADDSIDEKAAQAIEIQQERKNSIFRETATYIARVLRVEKEPNVVDPEGFLSYMSDKDKAGKSAVGKYKFVRVKAYIPKMHKGCYPTPRDGNTDDPNYPDHYII